MVFTSRTSRASPGTKKRAQPSTLKRRLGCGGSLAGIMTLRDNVETDEALLHPMTRQLRDALLEDIDRRLKELPQWINCRVTAKALIELRQTYADLKRVASEQLEKQLQRVRLKPVGTPDKRPKKKEKYATPEMLEAMRRFRNANGPDEEEEDSDTDAEEWPEFERKPLSKKRPPVPPKGPKAIAAWEEMDRKRAVHKPLSKKRPPVPPKSPKAIAEGQEIKRRRG